MRLIDVDTLEIKTFNEQDVPRYAILSHSWGRDEVTFQEMCLITRLRLFSHPDNSWVNESQIKDGEGGHHSSAIVAAVEMLMRGNLGAIVDIPNTDEEVLNQRGGYRKIVCSAREAKKLGLQWIWIDVRSPLLVAQVLRFD